jgi:hypothetical protein
MAAKVLSTTMWSFDLTDAAGTGNPRVFESNDTAEDGTVPAAAY